MNVDDRNYRVQPRCCRSSCLRVERRPEFFRVLKGLYLTNDGIAAELANRLAEAEASIAALRGSEQKYRHLFDAMGEGLAVGKAVRDSTGTVVDVIFTEMNQSLARLSGVNRDEMIGRKFTEFFTPADYEAWMVTNARVADTGEPATFEQYVEAVDRWYDVSVYARGQDEIAIFLRDMSIAKKAQAALRESEERQALLLKLSDEMRSLTEADAIIAHATRLLGDYLHADRTFVAEMEPDGVNMEVYDEYLLNGAPSVVGHHNFDLFGPFVSLILVRGEILAVDDIGGLGHLTTAERDHYAVVGIAAYLLIPLVRHGRFAACFAINHRTARPWCEADKALARQVADRAWAAVERARAEAALRASEERFQQFAGASSSGLWIRDADELAMEFISPAIAQIYGIGAEALLGKVERWAALIVPDDREHALAHVAQAKAGASVVHEFRIQRRSDGAFRWIRNTDFPLYDEKGDVERIGGIAEDVTEAKLAVEHQRILLHELQHRVRNIMGIIRSIGNRSANGPASIEEYRATLEGRMLALARVQALLTRQANAGGSLRDIITNEVTVQAHHQHQFELVGPDIMLAPKAVEVLTLALHELSTNALKYGAFSVAEGRLVVSWAVFEKRGNQWLGLDWVETGAPQRAPSTRRGFGSELIEARIPYELGGTGKISIEPTGARCRIEFPLKDAQSILETDSPVPATTFGGTIDMSGAPDLTGRTILVVEDDYYLASDTAAALRSAGAQVLGPCPSEDAVLDLLDRTIPSHAVLDLNLGGGEPRFEIARLLAQKGIPFLFLTGYDPEVIPAELAAVTRLQKPVPFRSIVEAVSQL